MATIFVSYSRRDQEFVLRLKAALAPAGHEVWIDTEGLRPSEQWRGRLESAIDEARAVLIVLSPDLIVSAECRHEIEHAASGRKKLVPILFRDVDPANVPETVRDLHWVRWRDEDDAADAAARTLQAIETDLEWVDRHTELLTKARAWEQHGRRTDLLLRGQALKEAEDWIAQAASHPKMPPSTLHAEYLLAGRRAATKRSRLIGAVSALVLAVTGAAGGWGWQQQELRVEEARTAAAQQKADAEEKKRLAAESDAAAASAREATARRDLAEAEAEKAREAERQQALLKQEQESLREVAEAYRLIYRDPAQAAVNALRAAQAKVSKDSARAMEDAWRVAIERRAIRLSMSSLRDIGGMSFVRRERPGEVYSVIGRNGRHVLMVTARAGNAYTPDAPGDVYLLDSQTLRTTALEVCGQGVGRPRLEYAGFSSTGELVFVARSFYVDVYDLDGNCFFGRRSLQFESTKQPVHLVAGLLAARFLVASDSQGRVWLLDTRRQLSPKPVEGLGRGTYDITSAGDALIDVPIAPDGRHAIGLFESGRAVLLRADADGLTTSMPLARSGVFAVAFDPRVKDAPRWAMAHADGSVDLWEAAGGQAGAQRRLPHAEHPVDVLAYAEDGTVLVTIDTHCAMRLWDTALGRLLHTQTAPRGAACPPSPRVERPTPPAPAAAPGAALPDTRLPRGGSVEARFTEARSEILELATSRDGRWLAAGGFDGAVHLWDLGKRQHERQWSMGSFDRILALAFSPDGERLAAASNGGKLGHWITATGNPAAGAGPADRGRIRAIAFTGPETLAIATDANKVLTWNFALGAPLAEASTAITGVGVLLAVGSPDRLIVGRKKASPVVLDVASGRVLEESAEDESTPMIAVDERGQRLASSDGRSIVLWTLGPLKRTASKFALPGARVSSLALSPDGRVLAAGFGDGTVRLWAAGTGQVLADLKGGHAVTPIDALCFLPGGQRLLSGGGDHKVVLWVLS